MAEIVEVNTMSTSTTVRLEGMSYYEYDRRAYWYVTESYDPPTDDIYSYVYDCKIGNDMEQTDNIELSGLSPDTTYYIHCLVEGHGGTGAEGGWGVWFGPLEITTLSDYTPEIKIMSFSVVDNGNLSATCTWDVSDYIDEYNWYISGATASSSLSGTESSSTFSETIWFDEPGEYSIIFTVRDIYTGYTDYITENVVIAEPVSPSEITINLFSVVDNEDLSATCTWIVSGYSSSYTWLIQTDNGDYAGNESSVFNTRTIYFDAAGEYTVHFTVVDDVSGESYAVSENVTITEPEPEPEPTWTLYRYNLKNIDTCEHISLYIKEYSAYCYHLRFAQTMRVWLYTTGSARISLEISPNSSFNYNTGTPSSPYNTDCYETLPNGNSCTRFDFSPNTDYYIFIRSVDGGAIEDAVLHMHLHSNGWHLENYEYSNLNRGKTVRLETEVGTMYKFAMSFKNSGVVKFYTSSKEYNSDNMVMVYSFLTTDENWNPYNGYPSNTVITDTNYYDEVSIEYNVLAGSTYYLWIRGLSESSVGYIDIHIDPPGNDEQITTWDWEIGTGSDKDIAYRAITKQSGYSVQDFKYTVWNDLVNKVYEVAEDSAGYNTASISGWLTSDGEGNTYLDYNDTLMNGTNEEGRTLTAAKFNALKYNIGARESTGIPNQIPGNPVLGEYFITLTECLNTFINKINNG